MFDGVHLCIVIFLFFICVDLLGDCVPLYHVCSKYCTFVASSSFNLEMERPSEMEDALLRGIAWTCRYICRI